MPQPHNFVGVRPWLPWPLSGWRWWSEPVRAERLAVLRIALAALMLADLLWTHLPAVHDHYGPDGLGRPALFNYLAEAPRWNLSLLRGFKEPLNYTLALSVWWLSGGFVLLGLLGRLSASTHRQSGGHPLLRVALLAWTGATVAAALGLWARTSPTPEHGAQLIWRGPMLAFGLSLVFLHLAAWKRYAQGNDEDPWVWRCVLLAVVVTGFLAVVGLWKWQNPDLPSPSWLAWTEKAWHHDPTILRGAMLAWVAATVLLLVGFCTRLAAVACWALALSFGNLNWYIDNAGDQIRGFILFYLMLCPCGAAWSVDSWLLRKLGRRRGAVYVSPWALRLLFVQMTLVYFLNGLYKVGGEDWQEGASLYYVLCDVTLSRFSMAELNLPYELTQLMSFKVLIWELTFPLLMLTKWTRVPALVLGVMFHVGILLTMEIGGFAAYMLVLYVPLLPWDRWLEPRPEGETELVQVPVLMRD